MRHALERNRGDRLRYVILENGRVRLLRNRLSGGAGPFERRGDD